MKRRYAVVVGMMLLLLTGCAGTEETATSNEAETGQNEAQMGESAQQPENSLEEMETEETKGSERVVQDGPYGRISLTEAEDSEIPEIALAVYPKEISAQGCTLLFTQYDREAVTELAFGEDFRIEENKDGEWQEAERAVQGEYGVKDIAYTIRLEDTTEYVYDWEGMYGTLEPGEYRIAVNVDDRRAAGDYDSYTLYAHFILR